MSDHGIKVGDLVVGQRYRVEFDDCCAVGWFEAAFVEVRFMEPDGDGDSDVDTVLFDAGEIGPGWGQWKITEVGGE